MIIQLSSGQGPAECELAVCKLFKALQKEYPDITKVSEHRGSKPDCCTSILFSTQCDLSHLEGSVQWTCKSPLRPNHKRKNWFVDVSIIPEKEEICTDSNIRFERFHSSGKGGQNVNKVETGVRLTHIPTGITAASTAQRSQLQNKKDALRKLEQILAKKEAQHQKNQVHSAWKEHTAIIRGNPVRIYEGMGFRLK